MTAKEYLKDKTIIVTVNGVNCKIDHSTDLENLLESFHKIKAENLIVSGVERRSEKFTCSCGIPPAIRLCEGVETCLKCGEVLSK